jgi:hypothetical protein
MTRNPSLTKLLSLASGPLSQSGKITDFEWPCDNGLKQQLISLLRLRNGFFCFESALQIFPFHSSLLSFGLVEWNSLDCWRYAYGSLATDCLFFGQDAFGGQYCILGDKVCHFDPETGQKEFLASSLEAWAEIILADYRYLTGHPVLHDWQVKHGPLTEHSRLVPRVPFVCGGKFETDNLDAVDSRQSMILRGKFAEKIDGAADGQIVSGW